MMRWMVGMTSLGIALVGMTVSTAAADTVLLNETFEGYADDSALFAVWGSGNGENFALDNGSITPAAFPNGGQGAFHVGGTVAEWTGLNAGNAIHPTATQSIRVEGDVYENGGGNKRMSIGLRGAGVNLVELGFYNSVGSCDPTVCGPNQAGGTSNPGNATQSDPGFYTGTGYAARLQVFTSPVTAPLLVQPDWQYFQLPIELDRQIGENPPNGIVNIADIGAGWHHYAAIITPDSVTLEIDLFRDGLRNTSRTPDPESGIRPGTPGVDASMTFPVVTTPAGFTSLRLGGPSGIGSAGGGLVYDNIKLSLIDVVSPGLAGDFDDDGDVDAADYTLWRDNLDSTVALPNDDGLGTPIAQAHYDLWKANFGESGGSGGIAAAAGVPEPGTALLALFAASFWIVRRTRIR